MSKEHDLLTKIGLSKNEADIYLCLLSNKELSAYEIAQKIGLHRPRIYDKLETLMRKGLVSEIKKENKKYFKAAHPSKLKSYLDRKIEQINEEKHSLETILPQLIAQSETDKEETKVEVFKGKEGLKGFLKDVIRTGDNICIWGLEEEYYRDNFPIGIQKYFEELKENNLKERAIIKDKPGAFMFDTPTTEYRVLKSKALSPTNVYIYGNKVGFIIWGNPISIIKIEHKNTADTYKEHFEHLWKLAKKVKKKS